MKVSFSFAALGLLLISAAQALPLPETDKCHVVKVQNNTAPVTKSLRKRYNFSIIPHMSGFDDLVLFWATFLGRKLSPKKKEPVSYWKDKENDRFESNSWSLSPHELNIVDARVEETGEHA